MAGNKPPAFTINVGLVLSVDSIDLSSRFKFPVISCHKYVINVELEEVVEDDDDVTVADPSNSNRADELTTVDATEIFTIGIGTYVRYTAARVDVERELPSDNVSVNTYVVLPNNVCAWKVCTDDVVNTNNEWLLFTQALPLPSTHVHEYNNDDVDDDVASGSYDDDASMTSAMFTGL